jgi:hypothetical protein
MPKAELQRALQAHLIRHGQIKDLRLLNFLLSISHHTSGLT